MEDKLSVIIEKIDKIDQKQDKLEEKQTDHTIKLEVYNAHLGEHISRTELLEARFKPIESHVEFALKISKIGIAVLGSSAGAAVALKIISLLFK